MHTEGSLRAHQRVERLPVRPWMRPLAWGILSFCGLVISVTALLWPMAQVESLLGLPHPTVLGAWAWAWTMASGLLVLVAARATLGRWQAVGLIAWLLLLTGAVISAVHLLVLADWMIARFGASDPEFVGVTFGLFAVVTGVAVAGFGVQVAPRGALWPPILGVALGVFVGASIVLGNVAGLADGLAADSQPLALVTVAAALYVAGVGVMSVSRLRHQ